VNSDLLVRGGRVVTSGGVVTADVRVDGETITEVGERLSARRARVIDADGAFVLPGVIDAHVHPIHGETVASVSEAAASAGVTTVLHHVYPEPALGMEEWLAGVGDEASTQSSVDFGFHARIRSDAPGHLDELESVAALGVRSFKVFTSYGLPGVRFAPRDLLPVMRRVRSVGGLLLVHAEDQEAIEGGERNIETGSYGATEYLAARPASTEADAIRDVAEVAEGADAAVYFVHVSSSAALQAITSARARGVNAFAETCPHYLFLDANDVVKTFGARAKIAPPLRSAGDRSELWAALSDGRVDLVASDHCGHEAHEKEPALVSFKEAGFGAPGIETLLPLLLDAVAERRLSLPRLVELLSTRPAAIFGFASKGRIEPGCDADLVIVDPDGSTVIEDGAHHGAAYYSLFQGRRLRGAINRVFLRGQEIGPDARDGRRRGRFVATKPRSTRARPSFSQ
jgi:dihydropyrimidinase